jgi:D-3-phosphoglycerate dehydrogenase
MTDKPHFVIATLSDRYNLGWERETLDEVEDLDAELVAVSSPGHYPPADQLREADALLISTRDRITPELLTELPKLKVISSYGVGLDHIDLEAAAERGVLVTHFPDYCTNEVADHAMSLILGVNRRIVQLDRDLKAGAWLKKAHMTTDILHGPVPALRDSTLGIVGFGRIGRAVARRAAPFGLKLLVNDPYIGPETAEGVELVALDELLERADIITLHTPLTKETRGFIGADQFARLKPAAFLVNTARGPLLDMAAAAAWAAANPQGGLALDVVDPEPLPKDSPFYGLDNVILTPHSAYYSSKSVEILREETLFGALDVLRGRRPRFVANPAVLDLLILESNSTPIGASSSS